LRLPYNIKCNRIIYIWNNLLQQQIVTNTRIESNTNNDISIRVFQVVLIQLSVVSQSIIFAAKSIMSHKQQAIGRTTSKARKKKVSRTSKTDEQLKARLETVLKQFWNNSSESVEQWEIRLETAWVPTARSERTLYVDFNFSSFRYDANYDYSLNSSAVIGKMNTLRVYFNNP